MTAANGADLGARIVERAVLARAGRDFPTTADHDAPTSASTLRWFVTAHTTEWRTAGGPEGAAPVEWPRSMAHAKQMGTQRTACGVLTASWPKLWNRRFPARGMSTCAICLDVVRDVATGPARR